MKISQFDAHNGEFITVEIEGPEYAQRIIGEGWFIIINPDSPQVSFSKSRHDTCMGDITRDIIPNYTNQQFADEYGSRMTGYNNMTVKEYMQQNCRMHHIV